MERVLFSFGLLPGMEAEYDRRHAEIWPELVAEIRDSGLRNMTGFRRGTDVWYYVECQPDAATAFAIHAERPANRRWNAAFRTIVATGPDASDSRIWYRELFHGGTEQAPPGPMRRALTSLVVDPMRADKFDHRQAHPQPELLVVVRDAGVRNFAWFRHGAHAVGYGEYFPDLGTACALIEAAPAGRRWIESFEGIVTTRTDSNGDPITAGEIYHQD
jgi:L-rhamnose mutarotase